MNIKIIKNILNDMLISLDEFKSEDIKYYKKQSNKIIDYIKILEKQNKE
tara:strand:- start:1106 stop:1252 length:147 start_codon:yes stop_codon:yes gene_type:complete